MGLRNFPCSTVKDVTEKSMGARFCNSSRASSIVIESLPPESATATRSPSRIILKRAIASPTLRSNVFSRSTFSHGNIGKFGKYHHDESIPPSFPLRLRRDFRMAAERTQASGAECDAYGGQSAQDHSAPR